MPQEVVWSDLQVVGDTSSGAEVSVDGLNPVDAAAWGGVLQHRSQTFKHVIIRASPIMLTVYYDTSIHFQTAFHSYLRDIHYVWSI